MKCQNKKTLVKVGVFLKNRVSALKLKSEFLSSFCLIVILLLVSCQLEMEPIHAPSLTAVTTNTIISQPTLELTTTSLPLPTTIATEIVEKTSVPVPAPAISTTPVSETVTSSLISATPIIAVITLTPLPTLEGEELETSVARLLENPMNCDVPCWWGSVPDVTSINEIKHAVSPYNFDIYEYTDGERTILRLGIGYVEERNDFKIRIGYGFSNSRLTSVSAYSPPIFEVLAKYGQPDEVWLATAISPAPIPVRLNLVYLQEGMAFGYVTDGDAKSGMFKGCFSDEEAGRLRLLVPDTTTSYKDFSTIFEEDHRYLLLEEATDLTMDDFIQQFSDPTQPQCIETPIELWD